MSEEANDSSLVQSLVQSGGIVLTGLVVEMVLSFLAKILMARLLGASGFGAVSLGLATFTIVSYLVLLGMDTGISRFMPRDDDQSFKRGVVISGIQLALPLSLVSGGILAALAPTIATKLFHDPATAPILQVFAMVVPLAVFVKLSLGGIRGAKKSLPKVYLKNILMPITRFSAIAILLSLGWNGVGIAWAYAIAYGLSGALGLYYLSRYTPLFLRISYPSKHRELLSFSAPLVISSAMALVFDKIDTIFLGFFWPSSQVGIYNVVYPLAWALLVMLNAFRYLFMPAFSELHADGSHEVMKRTYQMTTKWVFIATLPLFLGLVLFPEIVLQATFGTEYVAGALPLVILSTAFLTHAVAGPNKDALTSIGRTKLIMYDNVLVAGVNIVLNFFLIPRYAILGAAVATACSYVLLNLLYSFQLYRVTGIQPLTASQIRPGIITIFGVVGLYWLVTGQFGVGLLSVAVVAAAMVVGYPLVVLHFSRFEPEEVSTFRTIRDRAVVVVRVVPLIGR